MKKYFPEDFGYKGHEMLMHPISGNVQTAKEWADDCEVWYLNDEDPTDTMEKQFGYLMDVTWNSIAQAWEG